MTDRTSFPVILPSETQSREFDAKLLLACFLAERGHSVIVGSRIDIHNRIHTFPRGLYLGKDVRRSSRRMFRIMDKLGFAITAWDEEAMVFSDASAYHENRVDTENLNRIKAFLALGDKNREMIECAPGYQRTPVYVTGNPRIDLLTPRCRKFFDSEVEALRARFGEFILINSNFGRINHFLPSEAATRTADGGFNNLGGGTAEWWEFRLKVFETFKTVLPVLARAFPDRQIVLRPHPSEAHDVWREAAQDLPNVTIIHEGAVYPWIMASAVAVHNGCTTGLESYLMDHPVVAYQEARSVEFDKQLPNQVSTPVFSQDQLISTLTDLFAGTPLPALPSQARELAEERIGPLDGTLACERIDALIRDEGESWLAPRPSPMRWITGYIGSVRRQLSKSANAFRAGHKNSRAYSEHRFPGLSEQEAQTRLDRLSNTMGMFSTLNLRQVHSNIFCVSNQ
jgi:surface carbohydrate biosynthesis protein